MMRQLARSLSKSSVVEDEDIQKQRSSVMRNIRGQMESIIRERNDALLEMEKRRECDLSALDEARAELEELQLRLKREKARHALALKERDIEVQTLRDRMAGLENDLLLDTNDFLELVNEGCPDQMSDDPYVKRLQSRLAQALKQMAVMDSQIALAKRTSNEAIKLLKEEVAAAADERCKVEVDYMNQLATLSSEKRIAEEQYEAKIDLRNEEIQRIEQNLAVLQSKDVATTSRTAEQENRQDGDPNDSQSNAALKVQLNNLMHKLSILPDQYLKRIADRDKQIAQLRDRCYRKDKIIKKLQINDAASTMENGEIGEEEGELSLEDIAKDLPPPTRTAKRRSSLFDDSVKSTSDTSLYSLYDSSFNDSAHFAIPDEADLKAMISTVKYATRTMENQVQSSLKSKKEMICNLDHPTTLSSSS